MKKTETHRWAIDSIEEFIASVEVDGDKMVQVPQWVLPSGAKEGEVLAVRHERSDDGLSSTLSIIVDRDATARAHSKSAAVPERTGKEKRDPGGDIRF